MSAATPDEIVNGILDGRIGLWEGFDAVQAFGEEERAKALETAARWHEERADRVERESPGLGNFLSDTEREYIAKRAAADRADAQAIRSLGRLP
jgi:hypothetical protein